MALRRRRSSSPLAKNRVQSNRPTARPIPKRPTSNRPTATPIPKRPTSNRPTARPIPKRPKSISSRKDSPAERRMIEAAMRAAQARRSAQAKSKRTPTRRQRLLMRRSAAQRRMNDDRMTREGISLRRKSGKVSAPKAVKNIGLKRSIGRPKVPISKIGIPRRPSIAPPYMGPKRPNRGPIRKRPTRGPIRKRPPKAPIRKMPIGRRVPPKQYGPASKARRGPPKPRIRNMARTGPRRRSRFGRRR